MASRKTAHWTVTVNRPPDAVFDYLADVSRHGEWSPKPFRVEGLAAGGVRKGATYTSYGWIPGDKEHKNDVEVTECSAPTRLVLTATEPNGKDYFVNTFTVTAQGSGSKVEREMDMPKPGGFVGAIFPVVLAGFVKPAVQKGMNMFKEKCEAAG